MKKITLLAAFLAFAAIAGAQSPTTTYPYLYPTFIEGKVILSGGKEETKQMNIHLRRDNLHYIDGGIIKVAFLSDVVAVQIGTDVFIPVEGQMLKVVAKNEKGCVASEILGDFSESMKDSGAYGMSSSSSATMKLSSIQTDKQVNQNYMNILNEKSQGVELKLETRYWFVYDGNRIRASKKEVGEFLGKEMSAEWKIFLKNHKIKWREPQSLLCVLDYLCAL